MKNIPLEVFTQFVYGSIAICGGVARYLRGYADGVPFKLSIFAASAFVSGFGGWIFALMGASMQMPDSVLFIMAGIGGFFSDQSLKLALEWTRGKI